MRKGCFCYESATAAPSIRPSSGPLDPAIQRRAVLIQQLLRIGTDVTGVRQEEHVQHLSVLDRTGVGDAAVLKGIVSGLLRQFPAAEDDDRLPGIAEVPAAQLPGSQSRFSAASVPAVRKHAVPVIDAHAPVPLAVGTQGRQVIPPAFRFHDLYIPAGVPCPQILLRLFRQGSQVRLRCTGKPVHRQIGAHRQRQGQHCRAAPFERHLPSSAHALHDLASRRLGQFLRRQALTAQKFADGKAQGLRQGLQRVDARHAPAGLPFADGFVRHMEPLRQFSLAEPLLLTAPGDQFPGFLCIHGLLLRLVFPFHSTTAASFLHPTGRRIPHFSIRRVFFY